MKGVCAARKNRTSLLVGGYTNICLILYGLCRIWFADFLPLDLFKRSLSLVRAPGEWYTSRGHKYENICSTEGRRPLADSKVYRPHAHALHASACVASAGRSGLDLCPPAAPP